MFFLSSAQNDSMKNYVFDYKIDYTITCKKNKIQHIKYINSYDHSYYLRIVKNENATETAFLYDYDLGEYVEFDKNENNFIYKKNYQWMSDPKFSYGYGSIKKSKIKKYRNYIDITLLKENYYKIEKLSYKYTDDSIKKQTDYFFLAKTESSDEDWSFIFNISDFYNDARYSRSDRVLMEENVRLKKVQFKTKGYEFSKCVYELQKLEKVDLNLSSSIENIDN